MEIKAGETREAVATEKIVTSHPAEADNLAGDRQNDFGKFSTAEELVSAYNSLESEFTRRCQKLKELERENERLKVQEQTQKDSKTKEFQKREVAFKEKYPKAIEVISSLYKIAADSGDDAEGWLERAYLTYLENKVTELDDYYSSNEYIADKAIGLTEVKDRVIREYLDGVNSSKPQARQYLGNGESVFAPPSKPKNLSEAGELAKKLFEKSKEIR
jgi:hypothetical protein